MAGIGDKLSAFQTFLAVLSWKKIVQFFTLLSFLFLTWAVYENKESLYNYVTHTKLSTTSPAIVKISRKSIDEVDSVVKKSDLIVAIQVLYVDFQQNTRVPIYSSTNDEGLQKLYDQFETRSIAQLPLFTGDVANNRNIINLINGEFACYPFSQSFTQRILPEASQYIHTVCGQGIPPYYGRFTGMIVVYTKRRPTPEELDQLRYLSKQLSLSIYERDFK